MLIYLSHPIDLANPYVKDAVDMVTSTIEQALNGKTAHLFKPGQAFHVTATSTLDPTIERINQEAQNQASGLIVIWPHGSRSWGVPVEVERAITKNQAVAFISDTPQTWAMPGTWNDSDLFQTFEMDKPGIEAAVKWVTEASESISEATEDTEKPNTRLPYQRLSEDAEAPTRAYPDDAGLDLYVSKTTKIKPRQFVDIPCSVAVELNSNTWAMLTGRSSTLRKHGLMVNQGIIDPGYRGELYAGVFNLTRKTVTINKGDRIAQLILMPNWTAEHNPQEVNQLKPSPRGTKGFGSSGR